MLCRCHLHTYQHEHCESCAFLCANSQLTDCRSNQYSTSHLRSSSTALQYRSPNLLSYCRRARPQHAKAIVLPEALNAPRLLPLELLLTSRFATCKTCNLKDTQLTAPQLRLGNSHRRGRWRLLLCEKIDQRRPRTKSRSRPLKATATVPARADTRPARRHLVQPHSQPQRGRQLEHNRAAEYK